MKRFTVSTHHAYLNTDIIISNTTNQSINVYDSLSGTVWDVEDETSIRLTAGKHILKSGDTEVIVVIEDAIKFGGSNIKKAFVFDDNPWVFVSAKDRLYTTNLETGEEKVEYDVTPDTITSLGRYYGNPCEYFLFQTKKDFSIYNVLDGQLIITFSNHVYSNNHLVIYRVDDIVTVYDYRLGKKVVEFNGQFSFGSKFYFVKDEKLYGLNLSSSYINCIDFVGNIKDDAILYDNYLIKLTTDYSSQKTYKLFSLGNGEKNMTETVFSFPYYIETWKGRVFDGFISIKEQLAQFKNEYKQNRELRDVRHTVFGITISEVNYSWKKNKHYVKLTGKVVSYPSIHVDIPFVLTAEEGHRACFAECVVGESDSGEIPQVQNVEDSQTDSFTLPKGEKIIGKSESGKLVVSHFEEKILLRHTETGAKREILKKVFDGTHYTNAFFTSDGNNVVFEKSDKSLNIIGFENLSLDRFEISGLTVPKSAGINGYKPEIEMSDCRKPVWRDPISLLKVQPEELSDHVFMSPDRRFSANNNFKVIVRNRLSDTDITDEEYNSIRKEYDFLWNDSDEDKKFEIARRKQLLDSHGQDLLFKYIIERYTHLINKKDGIEKDEKTERIKFAVNSEIDDYINKKDSFTSLFLEQLGYVIYQDNATKEERKILIGRSVYFLNYVSFSYDSQYLAFGAKMRSDDFRMTEDGVFVLYNLRDNKEIIRQDTNRNLCAVWMTMFSKTGNVAYYDSSANAYIATKKSDYKDIEEISGKSLLCFSPSGTYIALSDQNYIDYTHHPNSNWGHQPSGNIFIHSIEDVQKCLEHYNDFGEGIVGVASRAGNVASAAFSSDERRLLAVGDDGVVVVRNLHLEDAKSDRGIIPFTKSEITYKASSKERTNDNYGTHYGEFAGSYAQNVMGYSDDVINDAFEGNPDNYWNID